MQSIPGSPIRVRTKGAGPAHAYRHGANRDGSNMDVLAEWRAPKTVRGGLYDTLLVAEQHGVLTAQSFHDTTHELVEIHLRFTEANPKAQVWFYEAWLGVNDKDDPSRWIAYERAASPVWQCIAARSSTTLAAMNRPTPIRTVPSGAALANLVDRATRHRVAGLSATSVRETMDRLFTDDVHLTPLGNYYVASVVYATLWGRSPMGASAPAEFDPVAVRSLQQEAWNFVSTHQANLKSVSFEACRTQLKDGFIHQHWSYVRDTQWAREDGSVKAYARWLKQMLAWHLRVRRKGFANPFHD